ncbi:MAG: molybdate ABC transporter substrate-binding protein [Syntrophales bacterium]
MEVAPDKSPVFLKVFPVLCCIVGFAMMTGHAFAAELRLYAAAGAKAPIIELAAEFEKASGHRIVPVFDTAGAAEQRFLADSGATFLITTKSRISNAEKTGKLKNGIVRVLGDTVGGFAAPPGQAKPDISTPEKLKAALLAAPRIAFSDPARGATVGTHFMKVIETLGIKEEVLKKSTLAKDGVETMRLILAGEADLGVTQLSEVMQANRAALVGPFPREFDLATTYSLWYRADATPAAKAFAELITGSVGRAKLTQHGLRPPHD